MFLIRERLGLIALAFGMKKKQTDPAVGVAAVLTFRSVAHGQADRVVLYRLTERQTVLVTSRLVVCLTDRLVSWLIA